MKPKFLFPILLMAGFLLPKPLRAEHLIFIAQLEEGVFNYSWFSGNNWFTLDQNDALVHAGRIPTVDDDAEIRTRVDAAASTVMAKTLLVKNVTVNGGNFQVPDVTLTGGCTFNGSTISISDAIAIGGTGCVLDGSTLTIQPGAFALFQIIFPAVQSAMSLRNGSLIANFGDMIFKTNSLLGTIAAGNPTNRVEIHPNAKLRGGANVLLSGTAVGTLLYIENSGTVQSEDGLFRLGQFISWSSLNSNCVFKALSGATLLFENSHTVPSNLTFVIKGPGLSKSASTLTVNGKIEIGITDTATQLPDEGHFETAASMDGMGSIRVRSGGAISNSLTFSGNGTLSVGTVTVDNGANFVIDGTSSKTINGTSINNSGKAFWRGSDANHLTFGQGMMLNNLASGIFNTENNAVIFNGSGTINPINNAGTFQKISGGGTSQIRVPFNNSGDVAIQNGTISLQSGFTQTAGTLNIPAGSALSVSGGALNLLGGKLFGNGLATGTVINGAKISPGNSPGVLTFTGGAYSQTSTGNLSIEIAGTNPGAQHDQLVISNSATLGGAISVQLLNGFVPTLGQQFEILKCASRSGTFAVKNGMLLPNGLVLVPVYSTTNVMLVASNVTLVQPLLSPTSPTAISGLKISWPTILSQPYQVEFSPDLENWYVLTNVLGSGSITNIIDPTPATNSARYYRVR